MQPLNDDMEDLFRQAAEEYPLDTSGADWNKVNKELHLKAGAVSEGVTKKRDYRFLWLLFLLPIGFICGKYIGNDNMIANIETNESMTTPSAPRKNTQSPGLNAGAANNESKGNGSKVATVKRHRNREITIAGGNKSTVNVIRGTKGNSEEKLSMAAAVKDCALDDNTAFIGKRKKEVRSALPAQTAATKPVDVKEDNTLGNTVADFDTAGASSTQTSSIKDSAKNENAGEKVQTKTTEGLSASPAGKEIKNIKPPSFKKTLSYLIVAGPDVSTVKLQKTSKVGYSLGIMLRYQFAKKISVEGGLLWDRKNYYTDGKYLDTVFLKLPMHSVVKNATGYCDMIEIPVNIRYDFIPRQKHSWFVSAGLSSYLMSKEDYNISYERYNVYYNKDYAYRNSTKNWFSIMNLSMGYQKLLGKYTNISIAPYIKLPLKQIGSGKLLISSTGIFLSVSRSFK
jgi:hypothetical protein